MTVRMIVCTTPKNLLRDIALAWFASNCGLPAVLHFPKAE